jgi:phosphoserine aminotransferase
MLCIEDARDALAWAEEIGGLAVTIARSQANFGVVKQWVAQTDWVEFLADDPATRSSTAICLKVVDPDFSRLSTDEQWLRIKQVEGLLAEAQAALDIAGHRDGPPGFRIWGGATVEAADIRDMLPWLDWAFGEIQKGS